MSIMTLTIIIRINVCQEIRIAYIQLTHVHDDEHSSADHLGRGP